MTFESFETKQLLHQLSQSLPIVLSATTVHKRVFRFCSGTNITYCQIEYKLLFQLSYSTSRLHINTWFSCRIVLSDKI